MFQIIQITTIQGMVMMMTLPQITMVINQRKKCVE